MTTTELTAIHTDTDDRYEFTLLVNEVLPVRVIVSTVFGTHYGAHAYVETGTEYAPEDAYLYNGNLLELPSPAVASSVVPTEKAAFRRHRILKTLASKVEGAIQALTIDTQALGETLGLLKDDTVTVPLACGHTEEVHVASSAHEFNEFYCAVCEALTVREGTPHYPDFSVCTDEDIEAEIAAEQANELALMREREARAEYAFARDEAIYGPSEPYYF